MSKKSKDILFLCQYFFPEYVSSATLPYDTACALVQSGKSVDVICGYPKEYMKDTTAAKRSEVVNGIGITRLKYLQLKRSGFLGRIINYFSFTFVVLLRLLKMKKYKVIFVYSNPPVLPLVAILAKMLFKTKVVFIAYDLYPEIAIRTNIISQDSSIARLMSKINAIAYKRFDRVVALSTDMKDFITDNREIDPENIKVICNWHHSIKGTRGSKNDIVDKLVQEDTFIVGYFGNIGIAQDIETILDAARLMKSDSEVVFLLVGHGNKRQQVKDVIAAEGMTNVVMLDYLHDDEYVHAIQNANCLLLSLAYELTGLAVPSKTYSYLSAGRPIIAVMDKLCQISIELESTMSGYHIDNGNQQALYDIIYKLKNSPELQTMYSDNAIDLFESKYENKIATQHYVTVVDELLKGV